MWHHTMRVFNLTWMGIRQNTITIINIIFLGLSLSPPWPEAQKHFWGPGDTHLFTSISRLGCAFLRQCLLLARMVANNASTIIT